MEDFEKTQRIEDLLKGLENDLRKIFLLYGFTTRITGITAVRDNYYSINNLQLDSKSNLLFKFPDLSENEFRDLWEAIIVLLKDNEIDMFEDMDYNIARKIYATYKKEINNFILNKIKKLSKGKKLALYLFLKNVPVSYEITESWIESFNKNLKLFAMLDNVQYDIREFLTELGLYYKGIWITAKGKDKGIEYHYPEYFENNKSIFLNYLEKCPYCGNRVSPRANKCPKCGDPLNDFIL